MINSGRIRLLDHPRLISQLCGLERRSGGRGGRDIIDHFPGSNDDIANSVACFASINTLYPQYDHEYRGFGVATPMPTARHKLLDISARGSRVAFSP